MGVAMWPWAGLYAPQLPKILLFAVTAALYNEFPKFFRVVIGHAKTDIWLQQLFWLRPFFDPSGPKNPFFTSFSTGPPEFCPGWIFNFLPKSGRPGLGIRPQPKISVSECIFLMSCEPFYLGHFFFCFVGFFSAFPHWTVT